jgi:hypothetical protein
MNIEEVRKQYFVKKHPKRPVQEVFPLKLTATDIRTLENGRASFKLAKKGGDVLAWLSVAQAITLLREKVLETIHRETPQGRIYNTAFGRWSRHLGLDMDKATRSRLLELSRHWPEVFDWLWMLPPERRRRLGNPEAIVRGWKKSLKEKS